MQEVCSALHVEFFTARRAVLLMKSLGLVGMKIHFEGDATLVLVAMKGQGNDCSELGPIINDLRYFLMEWSYVSVSHIPRGRQLSNASAGSNGDHEFSRSNLV